MDGLFGLGVKSFFMRMILTTSDDRHFMQLALSQAREADQAGEVPVGAVVVQNNQVIASAHNAPRSQNDPTAHAEINAIRDAAQMLGNYRLEDCTLYVTLEPCVMCCGALLNARFKRVVFGASEPKTGAVGSVVHLLEQPILNHQTQWLGGVLADEAAQLLQVFFERRRQERLEHKTPLRDDALRPHVDLSHGFNLPWQWSRFATEWTSLHGWRLHWFDNLRAPAISSVYLHGLSSWSAAYLALMQSSEHAVAIDLLGFGLSDKPKKENGYSVALHVDVLCDFFKHIAPMAQRLFAPLSMQPICLAVQQAIPHLQLTVLEEPLMSSSLLQAPYSDKGHLAGVRALTALLQE